MILGRLSKTEGIIFKRCPTAWQKPVFWDRLCCYVLPYAAFILMKYGGHDPVSTDMRMLFW